MFSGDMVEPTDCLYREGTATEKYKNQRKFSRAKEKKKEEQKREDAKQDKKIHKYLKDNLGSLVDVEV